MRETPHGNQGTPVGRQGRRFRLDLRHRGSSDREDDAHLVVGHGDARTSAGGALQVPPGRRRAVRDEGGISFAAKRTQTQTRVDVQVVRADVDPSLWLVVVWRTQSRTVQGDDGLGVCEVWPRQREHRLR